MKNDNIEYLCDATYEELFTMCLYGMEYGIGERHIIPKNNGKFDHDYIKHIIRKEMDDHDIMNELGMKSFLEILEDIPNVCREYLNLHNKLPKQPPEVYEVMNSRPEIYKNVLNSLNEIISNS